MTATDLTNAANLAGVLKLLSANSTELVKKGEKQLKPFLKQPACTEHLLNQVQNNEEIVVRHHAALLLKKKLGAFYPKFNAQLKTALKIHLLNLMLSEPDKGVRTSIAGCVAILAKAVFSTSEQWPELFSSLMQMSQDPSEDRRALNYNLLSQLSEHVAVELKPHVPTLAQMFVMGCQDTSSTVSEAALKAVSSFIKEIGTEPEVMGLQCVLNPMFLVMASCLRNGSEETVIEGLDVIQEACLLEQPLINEHLQVITEFILGIIVSEEYDNDLKQTASQTLMNMIECRPKLMAKKNLVAPILTTLIEMIAKQDSAVAGVLFTINPHDGILADESGKDKDDDEEDINRLAQTTIDYMAIHIPSKHFVEPALSLIAQGMSSFDPQMRKAGCAVLGIIAEGCSDRIRESLSSILPRLLELMQDPEYYVRECACFALGQFAEYCQPDILYHNATILPAIFQALDDPRHTVQGTSCYVLEYFCENLQPATLRPYLNQLMSKLANLLSSSQRTTQEMALSAIAATSLAAEADFLPYSEAICGIIGQLIFITEPAMFSLRGRALECLGHIGLAIGSSYFTRYFEQGMQSATQGVQLNDESLKEYSFVFVANCAKVMGTAYGPYLASLIPYLLEVINESEIVAYKKDGAEDDDDDEEGDDDDAANMNKYDFGYVAEGFINTKKAAIGALGALAEHSKELFFPFLESSMHSLLEADIGSVCSLHETIRAESLSVCQYMLQAALVANGIVDNPKFGEILNLNAVSISVAQAVLKAYCNCLLTDEEKLPVAYAMEGTVNILKMLGLVGLQLPGEEGLPVLQHLLNAIMMILTEKAPCQLKSEGDDKDDDEEDDEEDHDYLVMDSVTDLIGQLAKTLGPNFVGMFDQFSKYLLRYVKPSRPHTDRSMAIGCFGEVIAEFGPAAINYVDVLLPIIQTGLADNMDGVRRNSAYCLGVLVETTGTSLVPHYLTILQWLHPVCLRREEQKSSDTGGADVDNALATVARLITAAPSAVPLQHVLPVLLNSLPLRDDTSEGPCVYQCLAQLILTNEAVAVSMINQIVAACGETLWKSSTATTETKDITTSFLKQLYQSSPGYQNIISSYITHIPNVEDKALVEQLIIVH